MTTAYLRYSTDKQDEVQQMFALNEYAERNGLTIDVIEKDEGVSGGVSYRERKLYGLIKKMSAGDTLVVTEISRLGRSMADISDLLSKELKPRKIRLVVVKMGIDVDCANLKATDEFLFSALSFAAQIEKEMIVERTQAAIDARKEMIRKHGGFMSRRGVFCDHLGSKKGADMSAASRAGGAKVSAIASEWRKKSPLYIWVTNMLLKGEPRSKILAQASELYDENPEIYCTREGARLCKGVLSRWASEILVKN